MCRVNRENCGIGSIRSNILGEVLSRILGEKVKVVVGYTHGVWDSGLVWLLVVLIFNGQ